MRSPIEKWQVSLSLEDQTGFPGDLEGGAFAEQSLPSCSKVLALWIHLPYEVMVTVTNPSPMQCVAVFVRRNAITLPHLTLAPASSPNDSKPCVLVALAGCWCVGWK